MVWDIAFWSDLSIFIHLVKVRLRVRVGFIRFWAWVVRGVRVLGVGCFL